MSSIVERQSRISIPQPPKPPSLKLTLGGFGAGVGLFIAAWFLSSNFGQALESMWVVALLLSVWGILRVAHGVSVWVRSGAQPAGFFWSLALLLLPVGMGAWFFMMVHVAMRSIEC